MPRPFVVLALILAFSGTPLRLAEAADDQARSLAGPEDEGEFEVVDGGIGDDSGETVRANVVHASVGLVSAWAVATTFPFASPAGLQPPRPAEGLPSHPLASSPPGYILLERFLC